MSMIKMSMSENNFFDLYVFGMWLQMNLFDLVQRFSLQSKLKEEFNHFALGSEIVSIIIFECRFRVNLVIYARKTRACFCSQIEHQSMYII